MKKLVALFVLLATTVTVFAQNDDFRDFVTTRQKDYASSEHWMWDPLWGMNHSGTTGDLGKRKVRDALKAFFANMTVEVKEGKNNAGRLLFISHKEPITYQQMWYLSGFKYTKNPESTSTADEATANHKKDFVDKINEWVEPFGFQVEMAKNSEIGRMRYRNLITYREYGMWITIKPDQRAAFKKAKDTGFAKIVKVVNNRGNLSYHPFGALMKEYNEKHKNDKTDDQHSPSPFDDGEIRIGN